jgi:Tfp pilus assembly protein PilN
MITINFATGNYRLQNRILRGIAILSVLLAVIMAVILGRSVLLRRDIAALDKNVKEIQAAEEQIKPLLIERDRLVKDLTAMSGLVQARSFSWTHMLTNLERVVPVGVALGKMEFDPKERMLKLDGSARSPEALRNLMVALERTSEFQEPYLKHQSVEKGNISFNVVAFYRESKTASLAQAK